MPHSLPQWKERVAERIALLTTNGGASAHGVVSANAEMVERALRGLGPDEEERLAGLGARTVVNLAAVHVPSFCRPEPSEKSYKNAYDLDKYPRLGEPAPTPTGEIPRRVLVDLVLHDLTGLKPQDIYFGAVELNGSGIRFYGDVCLVLQRDKIADDTVVLSTNSYDLLRPPITPPGGQPTRAGLRAPAEKLAGTWGESMPLMGAIKTFDVRLVTERRLTTGQISEGVLEDEDYLEVLKPGTFGPADLQEARLSAAETAAENDIAERARFGPCPSLAEQEWRKHRRAALKALRDVGVQSRVVTTLGRVR